MKAILVFNLPEDKEEYDTASRGMDWALVVWEIDQHLRNELKYGNLSSDGRIRLEKTRTALNNMLIDRGLVYPE